MESLFGMGIQSSGGIAVARLIDCGLSGVLVNDQINYHGGDTMAGLEGQKAPAFTLAGSDGKQHTLSEYAGKNVILWFYPKDDTPG